MSVSDIRKLYAAVLFPVCSHINVGETGNRSKLQNKNLFCVFKLKQSDSIIYLR